MKIKKKIIATITLLVVIFNFISSINLESTKADEGNKEKTTISGILICGNCRDDGYIITHSRGCCLMASCGISGYGILVPQEDKTYKFYKFDEEGSDEAYELLKSFSDLGVSNYLSVNVTGYVNDTAGEYKYADGANTKTVKYEGSISDLDIEYDETHETYTKNAVTFNDTNVTIDKIPDQIYTGKSIKPKLTIKDGNYTLKATEDYNVSYKSNKDIGTATIVITGVGAFYKGTLTTTFNIVKETEKTDDTPKDNKSEVINSEYNNPKGYTEESTIWSYITFGSYPQSEVTGKSLTDNIKNADYDKNGDAIVNNNKYHRISQKDVTDVGDYAWEDGEYKYFKYEPIKWRVLNNNDDEITLVSDNALDDEKFNNSYSEVTWENSSLRTWLNSTFYDSAFNDAEKSVIINSDVENNVTNSKGINSGNNTKDKVYILSDKAITRNEYGFNNQESYTSHTRLFNSTSYAEVKGVNVDEENGKASYYWLRTSARDYYTAGIGLSDGKITYGYTNQNKVNYTRAGVIPVIKIKKNSDLWSGTVENPKYTPEKLAEYSYVKLGSYPQSEVKGSNLTSDIINAAYDENGDAVIGNNKYNRVNVPEKIEDGNITEAIKNYNYDIDGYYKDNNVIKYRKIVETKGTKTYNTYYRYEYKYFKYEPITWKVLSNDGINLKLLADKGLTTRQFYDKEGVEVKWATSTLRTWLNNDFYNKAFTETEKSVINNTTVETKGSEVNSEISGGDATQDKVYLLSVEDVRNSSYGFNSDPDINSPSRILSYTASSKAVAANNWTGFDVPEEWWLRSPGYWITNPVTVLSNGIVRASGRYDIYTVGVVPVIDVSIASLNKISNKTDDNKPSVSYQTHVQKIGWQDKVSNGESSGTTGKSLRLEGIKINVTGDDKLGISYETHVQKIGWMGWAKNGLSAGTSGYGYRLEAIQIKLVSKDGKAPGLVENAYKPK